MGAPVAVSDQQLVEQTDQLALDERQSTVRFVASLAEVDARRVYLALGYKSLFEYCTRRYHLSEHSALNRTANRLRDGRRDSRLPGRRRLRPVIVPLSEEHYKIQVTFTRTAHDKLRQAQALMRHQLPSGDPAAVLERGLDLLVADLLRKKAAAVRRARAPREEAPKGRHVPAHVKRKVRETAPASQ